MTETPDQIYIARARIWLDAHDYKLPAGLEEIALGGLLAAVDLERDERRGIGGNNPPAEARIDPEKLVDVAALPALLEANYQPLLVRGGEMLASAEAWLADHTVPRPDDWPEGKMWPVKVAIRDDADNGSTSDFMRQLTDFAGGRTAASGEVNEAREKVKRAPFDACKVIDAWFNAQRERHRAIAAVADQAQTDFLNEKRRREQQERQRLADEAAERARMAAEAARVAKGADVAVEAAVEAEAAADVAQRRAEAPAAALVRSTSMAGVTTTLATNWVWKVANKGALVLAAAGPLVQRVLWTIPAIANNPALQAEISKALKLDDPANQVSLDMVMENGPAITAAVRGKNGRRAIAGIEISEDSRASRR